MLRLLPFLFLIGFSGFAHWLDLINVLTYVGYEMNASPLQVSGVAIAMLLPMLLFGKLFAAASLRFNFRQIMAFTLIGRSLLSMSLLIAPNVEGIIAVLFCRSLLMGFMQPSLAAYVSQLQSRHNIAGILNMIVTSSKIVAPAIGGLFAVTTGELSAFATSALISALAACLVIWTPATTQPATNTTASPVTTKFPWQRLLTFCLPVIFIEGLSLLFSNLIPYSFNYYEVPKITLSLALSVSAIGNLLTGAFLVARPANATVYPRRTMFLAWVANSVLFAMLTAAMLTTDLAAVLIPLVFFCLASTKTFFDVSLNHFIFNQPKQEATHLATIRQSSGAGAGVALTLIGAAITGVLPPVVALLSATGLSLLLCVSWWAATQRLTGRFTLSTSTP